VLNDAFAGLDGLIIRPKSLPDTDVSWFAYPITLKKGDRNAVTERIWDRGVDTRLMFGGNITRQPMLKKFHINAPLGLKESDRVMRDAFLIGCNHSINEEEVHKIADVVYDEVLRG
jgi:CDP-6-deoxy-D-xylo-4-hexulose-3-dehydrase